MKPNHELTPTEVNAMGLDEFRLRFRFTPRDAIDKQFFAATGKRITPMEYQAIKAGVIGEIDLSNVNMDD